VLRGIFLIFYSSPIIRVIKEDGMGGACNTHGEKREREI
jgi:hypothetical protein